MILNRGRLRSACPRSIRRSWLTICCEVDSLKFLIECDGVLLDSQPAFWEGYCSICAEMGLPKSAPDAYWRAVRRGDPDGELIQGAKPFKLRDYRQRFDEWIETDQAIAAMESHKCAAEAMSRLKDFGECVLVNLGTNREARQAKLDQEGLSIHFSRMKALSPDRGYRVDQLRALCENDPQTVVVAASEALVLIADEAGLFCVGLSCGGCTKARLRRIGARILFADLEALVACVVSGGDELREAGLPG